MIIMQLNRVLNLMRLNRKTDGKADASFVKWR